MMATRVCILALGLSLGAQFAHGDEVRHTKFASPVQGRWASAPDQCGKKDGPAITIAAEQFRNADGDCKVLWIVERAAARGVTYGVHAQCTDQATPDKARAVDLIIWPQGDDRISVGKGFDDLKPYQRCPAE